MIRLRTFCVACFLSIITALGLVFGDFQDWHTSPEKWEKPRIYHTAFDEEFASRLRTGIGAMPSQFTQKNWSPNKAYWFMTIDPDTTKAGPRNTTISVFNEREYLLQISLLDHIQCGKPKVKWINEKLLLIRVWWGRVLGTDIIYDVEKEEIIYKEMFHDGETFFQQWQEVRERVKTKE